MESDRLCQVPLNVLRSSLEYLIVLQEYYHYYDGFYKKPRELDKVIDTLRQTVYEESGGKENGWI